MSSTVSGTWSFVSAWERIFLSSSENKRSVLSLRLKLKIICHELSKSNSGFRNSFKISIASRRCRESFSSVSLWFARPLAVLGRHQSSAPQSKYNEKTYTALFSRLGSVRSTSIATSCTGVIIVSSFFKSARVFFDSENIRRKIYENSFSHAKTAFSENEMSYSHHVFLVCDRGITIHTEEGSQALT